MVDIDYNREGTSAFNQPNIIKTEGAESNFSKLKRIGDIDKDLFRLDIDKKTIEYRDDGFLYGIKRGETEPRQLGYWLPNWMTDGGSHRNRTKLSQFFAHKDNADLSTHLYGSDWYGKTIKLQYDKNFKFINILPIEGRHPAAKDIGTLHGEMFNSRNKVLRRAFLFDKEKKHEGPKWKSKEERKKFFQYTKPEDMTDKPNMWINELYQIFEDNIPDRIEEFFRTDKDREEGPGFIDPHSNTGYENLKKRLYEGIAQKKYDDILPQEKKDIDKYLLTKPARDFFIHTLKSSQDIGELLDATTDWFRKKGLAARESISKSAYPETHDPSQFTFEKGEPWVEPKDKIPDEGHIDLSKYSEGWQMLLGLGLPKDSNVEFIAKGPYAKPLTAEGTLFKTFGAITPYSAFYVGWKGKRGLPGKLSGIPVRYRDKRKTQSVLALKKTISAIEGMKYPMFSVRNLYKFKKKIAKTGLLRNIELRDDFLMGMLKVLKTEMIINAAAGGGVYLQELFNLAGSDGDGDLKGEMLGMMFLPAILNGLGGSGMELLSLAVAGTIKNNSDRAFVIKSLVKKGYLKLEDISEAKGIGQTVKEVKKRWGLGLFGDRKMRKLKKTINIGWKKNVPGVKEGDFTYVATPGLRGKELKALKQIRKAIKKLPPEARDDLIDTVVNMKRLIERTGIPEHEISLMLTDLVDVGILNAVRNKARSATQVGRITAKVSTEDLLPSKDFEQAATKQFNVIKEKVDKLLGKYGNNSDAERIFNKVIRDLEITNVDKAQQPLDAATNVKLTIRQLMDFKKSGKFQGNYDTVKQLTEEEQQYLVKLSKDKELGDDFFHLSTRNRIMSHLHGNYSRVENGFKTLDLTKFKSESEKLLSKIKETKHNIGHNLYNKIDGFKDAKLQLYSIKDKTGRPIDFKRSTSTEMIDETILDPTVLYDNITNASKGLKAPIRMRSQHFGEEMLVDSYFKRVRNEGLAKFLGKATITDITSFARANNLGLGDIKKITKEELIELIPPAIIKQDAATGGLNFFVNNRALAQQYDFRLTDLLELNGTLFKASKKLSADASTKQSAYYVNEMASALNNALTDGRYVDQTGTFIKEIGTGVSTAKEYWRKYIVNAEYYGAGKEALGLDKFGNRITASLDWTNPYLKATNKSVDAVDRSNSFNALFFRPTQEEIKRFKISDAQQTSLASMRNTADDMLRTKFVYEFATDIKTMSKDDFAQDIAQGFTKLGFTTDSKLFPQLQPIIRDVIDIAGKNRKRSKAAVNSMGQFLDSKIEQAEYLGNKIKAKFIGKQYVDDARYNWVDEFARSISDPKKHRDAVDLLTNAGRRFTKETQFGDATRLDQLFEILSKGAGKDTVVVKIETKTTINKDVQKELDAIVKKEKIDKINWQDPNTDDLDLAIQIWSKKTKPRDLKPLYEQTGGREIRVDKKDLEAVRGLLLNGVLENPTALYSKKALTKRLGGNATLADEILLAARNEGDFGVGLRYLIDNEKLLHRLYPGKEGAKHLSQVKDLFSLGFSLFNDTAARKLLKIGNAPGEYTISQLLGRGYNISKGVVSPRYVLSELAINMMRQAQYRLLFDVVKNKASANIMYDLLINDQALPLGFERLFRGWFLAKMDEWLGPEAVEEFKKTEATTGHFNKDMNEYNMAGLIKLNDMGERTLVSGNKQLEYRVDLPLDFFSTESRGLTTKKALEQIQKKPGEFGIYPKSDIRTKKETEDQMNKLNIPKKTEQIRIQG